MNTTMAQKNEFLRYQNYSTYDTRICPSASHRDTEKRKISKIVCFRCNGNHHIKDCKICAYCKDIDNPHNIRFCPKTNYCSYCRNYVGHNIKRCPILNNNCPVIKDKPKKEVKKVEFSFNLLDIDSDESDTEMENIIDNTNDNFPELESSSSNKSYISKFSLEYKNNNDWNQPIYWDNVSNIIIDFTDETDWE